MPTIMRIHKITHDPCSTPPYIYIYISIYIHIYIYIFFYASGESIDDVCLLREIHKTHGKMNNKRADGNGLSVWPVFAACGPTHQAQVFFLLEGRATVRLACDKLRYVACRQDAAGLACFESRSRNHTQGKSRSRLCISRACARHA